MTTDVLVDEVFVMVKRHCINIKMALISQPVQPTDYPVD
ncbi:hypothetical protein DSUL_140110 [Desulfovibrionales bacterium]